MSRIENIVNNIKAVSGHPLLNVNGHTPGAGFGECTAHHSAQSVWLGMKIMWCCVANDVMAVQYLKVIMGYNPAVRVSWRWRRHRRSLRGGYVLNTLHITSDSSFNWVAVWVSRSTPEAQSR